MLACIPVIPETPDHKQSHCLLGFRAGLGYRSVMTVLAFDTTFGRLSVAVRHRGDDGAWRITSAGEMLATGHAERLLPMVQQVMREARVGFGDLARIAVSVGPGTFTGVRTGIAAARAIALSTGVPVCGISSLALMWATARREHAVTMPAGPLAVTVDARRGEVYIQVFAGSGAPLSEPLILTVDVALSMLSEGVGLLGSGGPALQAAASRSGRTLDVRLPSLEPDAAALAAIADKLPILDVVKPLYLRAPDAKPQTANSLPRAIDP